MSIVERVVPLMRTAADRDDLESLRAGFVLLALSSLPPDAMRAVVAWYVPEWVRIVGVYKEAGREWRRTTR